MATSIAIKARRSDVLQFTLQGMTGEGIAKNLGVSPKTIDNDLAAIRSQKAIEYQKSIGWERLAQYNEGQRLRTSRLWKIIIDKEAETRNVLRAIRELREEENLSIRKDQTAGILPRETTDQMQPIIVGDNSDVRVQQVNIYQTLMQIAQTKQQVEEDLKKPVKKQAKKKPKAKIKTITVKAK